MNFQERSDASDIVIRVTKQHVWSKTPNLYHVETGYETHIPDHVRDALRYVRTKTARHVRYAPDFLILDNQRPDNTYLLEYKSTQTPIYSQRLIDQITRKATRQPFSWQDIGRCEQEAFDNYTELREMGIRVAVLYYIAYHERLLLCDFIQNIEEIDRSGSLVGSGLGSRTPIVNFDSRSMRSLPRFLSDTHGIPLETVASYFQTACRELRKLLPVEHHPDSPQARRET